MPLAGMPESVLKLTYGANWEGVRAYLQDLAATLPYRLTAALATASPPPPFQGLVEAFRDNFPDAAQLSTPAATGSLALYAFDEAEVNAALERITLSVPEVDCPTDTEALIDYLQALLATATDSTTRLLFKVLGALGHGRARDVLLGLLESEGRHPYTAEILQALSNYAEAATLVRLVEVYRTGKIGEENLPPYLGLLKAFSGPFAQEHLVELLDDHPRQVEPITEVLRSNHLSVSSVSRIIHTRFDREQDYPVLDGLLRELLRLEGSEAPVSLADMNQKVDAPAFTDVPPVNWPQQLEPGWAELVRLTPRKEALDIISEYLNRPEPRLQRNALLQLKVLLSGEVPADPLPERIESRLRTLVASRYDKVYVEALNVLGRRALPLADRTAMLDAVLGISIGSRYRFVVLTALRRIGHSATYRDRARDYLLKQIRETTDPERLEQIAALLPFVEKYLGDIDDLRQALRERVPTGGQTPG
ncbi:hypothetical protein CGL56_00840 [Neolewinella marina]|uniref:Uncharacterized protein n=1 Tax=Neolewinella marina TaxID=438751 RepID=A0A2G0CI71_9BACT|nr:hypothetical protein CGL56_00840 [Neolewinella marina]